MDRLTGLPDGRDLKTVLDEMLGASSQCSGVFVDIDGFGAMNYELGHLAADEALQKLANWLAEAAGAEGGRAARVWGDEFMLFLPGRSVADAGALATRLVKECPGLGLPYHHPLSSKRTFTISAAVFLVHNSLPERATEVRESLERKIYERKLALERDHEVVAEAE